MKFLRSPFVLAAGLAGVLAGACVHTPPGTSVNIALAKRPQVVQFPATPAPLVAVVKKSPGSPQDVIAQDKNEMVADAFSRGSFCMKAGKNEEAIAAFREAVKVDPNFSEAWNNLALLYENSGQEKLAMEAFRRAKKIASQ